MPVVRGPDELTTREGTGWTETLCASAEVFGTPEPVRARRIVVAPGASAHVEAGGTEAMAYVAGGSGVLEIAGERHPLARESMAWIDPPGPFVLVGGTGGLEVFLAEAPVR
jgi:quercetin dioxygenase-like cupin family protein